MNLRKLLALLLALAMMLSMVACGGGTSAPAASDDASSGEEAAPADDAAAGDEAAADAQANDPYADPYKNNDGGGQANDPYADPYKNGGGEGGATSDQPAANAETYVPENGEHYTVEQTADGWLKIVNDGGETLGLSPNSGVKLVEADGFAFKDLNQNGQLDPYEDWRLSSEERANNLLDQMDGVEMAAILSHGGWGDFTTEPLMAGDGSATYLQAGGRGGVTRQIARGGGDHAKWANAIQTVAESCYYGIPAMISIDPANISGLIETLSLASTMDPELAAKIGQETAKQYRAAGVTALLGPQVDIASPVMNRAGGTYGEDPALTRDIATAYVNAMQSTYAEDGTDLGWGTESVYCFTKHFGGAGSTEAGRDDHSKGGRYAVFPGDNLEAHLISYFDGVFALPGATKCSGIMTEYAVNVDGEGNPVYGGDLAGAYNPYLNNMLTEAGYDSLKITDWGVFGDFGTGDATGTWGTEGMPIAERIALCWERGGNLLGGEGDQTAANGAYLVLLNKLGEEQANQIIRHAAYNFILVMMNLNMFDQPYCDSAYADTIVYSDSANAYGLETQRQSVVMLKNDGTIKQGGNGAEKPTVYIPYVYSTGFSVSWMMGIDKGTPSWTPGMDLDVMGQYFNVVTDTLGDPTGPAGADGNPTYTKEDLTRATAEEIAACDYILVGMKGAYSLSYDSHATSVWSSDYDTSVEQMWYPASLQYGEYTADTARDPSIAGVLLEDGTRDNMSYKGNTAPADANYGHLEALQYAESVAGEIPVIASVSMERGMVWSEVEPLADVILVCYNMQRPEVVAEIICGKTEPNGLLVFQQPKDMESVEAQVDDVPRDVACYTDAAGNTYDFAFGLNWSGVIQDSRVSTYSAAPLTHMSNFDYAAYAAANKG